MPRFLVGAWTIKRARHNREGGNLIGLTETLDRVDPLSAASGPGTGISLCGIRAPHAVLTPGETVQASA